MKHTQLLGPLDKRVIYSFPDCVFCVYLGSPALTLPVKKYGPEPTVVVLAGEVLTVQCLFSGL